MDVLPYGACDPTERLAWMDGMGIAATMLYPTIGIAWECGLDDPELSTAYTRAYNRWIADFCRDSGGRLLPIAHLSLADPGAAAAELERAAADGCRGAFVAPFTWSRVPHGHPDHDEVWRAAERLGVPVTIHPSWEPEFANTFGRFEGLSSSVDFTRGYSEQVMALALSRHKQQQAFASFFLWGTFDRFPELRVGVLESGAGWTGAFLDRLDTLVSDTQYGPAGPAKHRPSEYFRRQCFVSVDVDETAAPLILDHVGAECFVLATDYPHPDHAPGWRDELARFVAPLSAATTTRLASANLAARYGL
jgi:predicted TIM-barrel fold metal-dependent hydrolase